jgi:predicted PurR-regulated permease PerM
MNEAALPEAEPARAEAEPVKAQAERLGAEADRVGAGAGRTGRDPMPVTSETAAQERRRLRPPTQRVGLLVGAAVVVGIALYLGREALSPFIVGLMLVYLLDPAVERLSRLRVPRWSVILLVYAAVVVVVSQAVAFTIRPLVEQIRTFIADLPGFLARLDALYRDLDIPPQLREAVDHWLAQVQQGGGIDPGVLLPFVNVTAGLVSALFGYIIIPVWVFYLLKDRPQLTEAFDRSLPAEWSTDIWNVIRIVERVFSQWVRGQLILGVSVGVATFLGLMLLGTTIDPIFSRFALLLSIIAGVLELLPIIGPIIAAIPAILLAATAGPQQALAALVLYTVVQQLENNILVPKIQGDAVQLHPGAVMFALVMGGAIYGLLGAILALPITAAGRDVYRYLFRRLSDGPPAVSAPAAAVEEAVGEHAERAIGPPVQTQVDAPVEPQVGAPRTPDRPRDSTEPPSENPSGE